MRLGYAGAMSSRLARCVHSCALWFAVVLRLAPVNAGTVLVTNSVAGEGVVVGTGAVEVGAMAEFRAVPQVDWRFDHWEGLMPGMALINPAVVEVSAGLQPTAVFVPDRSAAQAMVWGAAKEMPEHLLQSCLDLSFGRGHALVLRPDGTVTGWGDNEQGQAVVPEGLGGLVSVAAGYQHSLALRADGSVRAWGWNSRGQIEVPASATNLIAAASGGQHSLGLRRDGTILGWGSVSDGESIPPQGLGRVVQIAAGNGFSVALLEDGTVRCWGFRATAENRVPPGLKDVVQVSATWSHSLALRRDGSVVAWGNDSYGDTKVPDFGGRRAVKVAAGYFHSMACLEDGTVVGWGFNGDGRGDTRKLEALPRLLVAGNSSSACLVAPLPQLVTQSATGIRCWDGEPFGWVTVLSQVDSIAWLRDAVPVPTMNSPRIEQEKARLSDSGFYRLVGRSGDGWFCGPALDVQVIPTNSIRVLADGREVGGVVYQTKGTLVELRAHEANASIRYSIGGGHVDDSSPRYEGPFWVGATTLLRTCAVDSSTGFQGPEREVNITVEPAPTLRPSLMTPLPIRIGRLVVGGALHLEAPPVTGESPLAFQWLFNGKMVVGATNAAYRLERVAKADAGNYSVRILNAHGFVTSQPLNVSFEDPEAGVFPLDATGWNADVVLEPGPNAEAQGFDSGGNCWFATGLNGFGDGLPPSRRFASLASEGVEYALARFDRANVVLLRRTAGIPGEGTLRLNPPRRLSRLALLMASANGDGTVDCRVELADGTLSRSIPVRAFDWSLNQMGVGKVVALRGIARTTTSASPVREPGFGLFETVVDLEAEGLLGAPVRTLHFTLKTSGPSVGIFAVSGRPAANPELQLELERETGHFNLLVYAAEGADCLIEVSPDLRSWDTSFKLQGAGFRSPARLEASPDLRVPDRFWRVRVP